VTDRPILFNDAMVRAILGGAKTQTRRPVGPGNSLVDGRGCRAWHDLDFDDRVWVDGGPSPAGNAGPYLHVPSTDGARVHRVYPRVFPGDHLWVREAHAPRYFDDGRAGYRADYNAARIGDVVPEPKWTPSIHMRRADSRLALRVTDVRVERVQNITEEDARAEGITDGGCLSCGEPEPCGCSNASPCARDAFAWLWRATYGDESWAANPWVWVVGFEVVP
jgi:hypothetical protein